VVLSVGFEPGSSVKQLAETTGVELNEYGFCRMSELAPMESSVPGVFVCGAFAGPKDIPETVVDASGAAAKASELIAAARNTLVTTKSYPDETEVSGEEPRIGVFVCHCGINIGAYVDVPAVVEYAKSLPNVVHVDENLYTCSQDTQQTMVDRIREHGLNRVVVASCTPRTHEPLFQETLREAGLNPYLFEMANIRDQCSWVHMNEPERATQKAKDLVRMAVGKARRIEPLAPMSMDITQKALVIGGGLAGMTAALAIAGQGFDVHLVEREGELGGNARRISHGMDGEDVREYLDNLVQRVESEGRITVHTDASIVGIDGFVGNFVTRISVKDDETEVEHGAVVVATGAKESRPDEYLFGENEKVVTQHDLEGMLADGDSFAGKTVTMIQCVGSREDRRPYCSRVCCRDAIKNAIRLKEASDDTQVFVLYRDMRAYGYSEKHYRKARELGVIFIRYEVDAKPDVSASNGGLDVKVKDRILDMDLNINTDLLVLSPAIEPHDDAGELAKQLKVPLNSDGFFLEAHVKLRPVDFATDGVFLAGMAHSPKTMGESIAQAYAAGSRASILLSQGTVNIQPMISSVNEDLCIGCGLCASNCPYSAIELRLVEGGKKAHVISASCKGCGVCGASCPKQAITMRHFTNDEINAQIIACGEKGA
jgi:heterodisulfide reductase subunit A